LAEPRNTHRNTLHQNGATQRIAFITRAPRQTGRLLQGQRRLGPEGSIEQCSAIASGISVHEDDPTPCSARLMSAKSGEWFWEVEGTRDGEQLS
jgi:hypothetical protein